MLETGEYLNKGFKPRLFDGIGAPYKRELSRLGFRKSEALSAPTLEPGSKAAVWASHSTNTERDQSRISILAVVLRPDSDELHHESLIWYANIVDPNLLSIKSDLTRAREILCNAEFGAYALCDSVKFLTTELFGPQPCF